ncbi:MAG: phosphatase PAP2 family protein, partial [Pirellulaceae bacterium]
MSRKSKPRQSLPSQPTKHAPQAQSLPPGSPALEAAPPVEVDPRRKLMARFLWWGLLLLPAAALVLPWDTAVARSIGPDSDFWGGEFRKMIHLSESFAHGTGVILISLGLFALDPVRRWKFGLPMAVALLAGSLCNVFKGTIIARTRPHAFDLDLSVWDSFGSPLPIFWDAGYELTASEFQSFPSGHAATAAGFCVALTFFYPRARWFFLLMLSLACLQRIVAGSHFPSDVLVGTAVGFSLAALYVWFAPERWAERASRIVPIR